MKMNYSNWVVLVGELTNASIPRLSVVFPANQFKRNLTREPKPLAFLQFRLHALVGTLCFSRPLILARYYVASSPRSSDLNMLLAI